MNPTYRKLSDCLNAVRTKTDFVPEVALVLGSGLGDFADRIRAEAVIEYSDIPEFPHSTVPGHRGRFIFGHIGEKPIVAMQGRVHYYEGYDMSDVVLPVHLMGLMGAKTLLLTNAAGGISANLSPGDLMLITGQIASLVPSPLRGCNMDELGTRFPDMSKIYSKALSDWILSRAEGLGIPLKQGTYLQASGPQYETPQEIAMYRSWGADAVGMSTACEAIAAAHMGLAVCGISCITNMAAGISSTPLSHDEVKIVAGSVSERFSTLVYDILSNLPKEER